MTGAILAQCKAGDTKASAPPLVGDTRPGAIPRNAAVWQSMAVRTDGSGAEVWRRVDAWRPDFEVPVGHANFTNRQHSSASEYVVKALDSGLAFINDEASGIGLMKHKPPPDVCDNNSGLAALAASNGRPGITTCARTRRRGSNLRKGLEMR